MIVYFSVALTTKQVIFSNIAFEEYLLAKVVLPIGVSLILASIYKSPDANKFESTRLLCEFIQKGCNGQPFICY